MFLPRSARSHGVLAIAALWLALAVPSRAWCQTNPLRKTASTGRPPVAVDSAYTPWAAPYESPAAWWYDAAEPWPVPPEMVAPWPPPHDLPYDSPYSGAYGPGPAGPVPFGSTSDAPGPKPRTRRTRATNEQIDSATRPTSGANLATDEPGRFEDGPLYPPDACDPADACDAPPIAPWLYYWSWDQFWHHAWQPGKWRHRPLSVSWFTGVVWGDDLQGIDFVNQTVTQDSGFLGGLRAGWDWTDYFGGEVRLGIASIDLGAPLEGLDNDLLLLDGSVLFYPTGDTRLRPYLLTGIGLVNIDVATDDSRRLLGMPLGGGLKYRVGNRLALRLEVLDNIAFPSGSGLETMHNLSLTAGLEFRVGGSRRNYWPWRPDAVGW